MPGGGGGAGDEDREILRQHEQALQRLEELQKGMIGGERAGMLCSRETLGYYPVTFTGENFVIFFCMDGQQKFSWFYISQLSLGLQIILLHFVKYKKYF